MDAVTGNPRREITLEREIERVSRIFSKQEIASFAGVSREDVSKFENGESLERPVTLKLERAYHSLDAHGFRILSPYR